MKKWETVNKFRIQNSEFRIEDLIKVLLENRGLKNKKEVEEFLNPELEKVTCESVGIDKKQLGKAIKRIEKAIVNKEQIVVFGDYDVDGITGTAIVWETLHALGAQVVPYIPHRIDEGYGLSIRGIENLVAQGILKQVQDDKNQGLIITVDNGIVASDAVEFANKNKIDVIITDHHVPSKKLPKAHAIVHTTKVCGAGVAYLLSQELKVKSSKFKVDDTHLELVALATVADLVPLTGANRTLLKFGLEKLRKTKRLGLVELFKEAALDKTSLGVYEIGHMIAPRLNAMGRLEYGMDSLRLLCTKNPERAEKLAQLLGTTNRERQVLTQETVVHALAGIRDKGKVISKKLLFVVHEEYQQGVIGLVAGRLVEEFYRPAIVIAKGEPYSKASARSVSGFNIIEFIRSASELLVDVGGHPMAAGFTVQTSKITVLQNTLEKLAEEMLTEDHFKRTLRIDCELSLELVESGLYKEVQNLSPFGMGNPEPTFVAKKVELKELRIVGRDGRHLKLKVVSSKLKVFDGIGFGLGNYVKEFKTGDVVDIVYTIDMNEWQGRKNLQLKVKDIKVVKN